MKTPIKKQIEIIVRDLNFVQYCIESLSNFGTFKDRYDYVTIIKALRDIRFIINNLQDSKFEIEKEPE